LSKKDFRAGTERCGAEFKLLDTLEQLNPVMGNERMNAGEDPNHIPFAKRHRCGTERHKQHTHSRCDTHGGWLGNVAASNPELRPTGVRI